MRTTYLLYAGYIVDIQLVELDGAALLGELLDGGVAPLGAPGGQEDVSAVKLLGERPAGGVPDALVPARHNRHPSHSFLFNDKLGSYCSPGLGKFRCPVIRCRNYQVHLSPDILTSEFQTVIFRKTHIIAVLLPYKSHHPAFTVSILCITRQ